MTGYDAKDITKLNLKAVKIRKHIIEMLYRAKSGHPGGSLSAVDALVALYFFHMKLNQKNHMTQIEIVLFLVKVMLRQLFMQFLQKEDIFRLMN